MKLVSIIMATYNRASFIVETLESIKNQTYSNFECIIIDDGGTDNTRDLITPILNSDYRFSFKKRPDNYQKGLPGSRNYGLDIAKGDFVIFFDDDDIVHPQNLEICVQELSKSDISFCRYIREVFIGEFDYSSFDFSKEYSSFYIDKRDINKILRNELQFNSCAVMWKKECFAIHRYTEHLKYAEEWEVYARVITSSKPGISINKKLYFGRKHGLSSITGSFNNGKESSRASYVDAIELVLKNLKKEKLLSYEIIYHFVNISLKYKGYNLYNRIVNVLELSALEKIKWKIVYLHLPSRVYLYKIYKNNLKKKNS